MVNAASAEQPTLNKTIDGGWEVGGGVAAFTWSRLRWRLIRRTPNSIEADHASGNGDQQMSKHSLEGISAVLFNIEEEAAQILIVIVSLAGVKHFPGPHIKGIRSATLAAGLHSRKACLGSAPEHNSPGTLGKNLVSSIIDGAIWLEISSRGAVLPKYSS